METSLSLAVSSLLTAYQQLEKGSTQMEESILETLKLLKTLCSRSRKFQAEIVGVPGSTNSSEVKADVLAIIESLVEGHHINVSRNVQIKSFQLLANSCVDNFETQEIILSRMSELITRKLACNDKDFVNVAAMICHCMCLSDHSQLDRLDILKNSLGHFKLFLQNPSAEVPDFVHILLDHLICTSPKALGLYKQLEVEDQKAVLHYIHDYIEIESNE